MKMWVAAVEEEAAVVLEEQLLEHDVELNEKQLGLILEEEVMEQKFYVNYD